MSHGESIRASQEKWGLGHEWPVKREQQVQRPRGEPVGANGQIGQELEVFHYGQAFLFTMRNAYY